MLLVRREGSVTHRCAKRHNEERSTSTRYLSRWTPRTHVPHCGPPGHAVADADADAVGRLLALRRLRPKKWKRVQLRSVRAPRAAAALRLWLRRAPLLSRARAASRSRLGAPPPEGEQHTSPPESRSGDESTSATPCVQDETKRKKQKTGDRAARRSGARARLQRVHLECTWRLERDAQCCVFCTCARFSQY